MSGWAGAAQGFASGLDKGLSIGSAFQNRELAEKKQRLDEIETGTKLMEYARLNPATGEKALKEFWTQQGINKTEQDEAWKVFKGMNDQEYEAGKQSLLNMGVKTQVSYRDWMKMSMQDKIALAKTLREQEVAADQRGIIQQELGGTPGAPPTAVSPPQPGVGAPPATGEPSLSDVRTAAAPVAGPPGVVPPVAPAAAPGGAAPPFRGEAPPAPVAAPGGGGGGAPAPAIGVRGASTPALSPQETQQKELYQRQLSTARRLQGLGPESAKNAKEFADAADDTAKRAWRQASPQELSRVGALPGAIGKYNPILDITEVTTQGQQTVSTSNPELAKQLLGAAYKPGDVLEITRGAGGVITGIKQLREGVDQLIRVDPGSPEGKKLRLNADALAYRNPRSGEIMIKEKGTDQVSVLTPEQAQEKFGISKDTGIYALDKSGKPTKIADAPPAKYHSLTQAEKKERNLDPKKDWQVNEANNQAFLLGSQTEADPTSKELAKQDIEQLGKRREMGGAAADARAKASNIRELLKTARPGLFANERAWLGGLVQELTGKAPSGTASLEALRGQLEEGALGKSGQLSGSIQVKELDFIRRAGPALFNTKEGNEILVDLMDESAARQERIADLAEEWAADGKNLSERSEKHGGKNFYQLEREIKREDLPESIRSRITQEIDLKNAANMDFTKVSPERAAELAGNTRFINSLSDARKAQLLKALGYEGKLPGQPGYVNPYAGAR